MKAMNQNCDFNCVGCDNIQHCKDLDDIQEAIANKASTLSKKILLEICKQKNIEPDSDLALEYEVACYHGLMIAAANGYAGKNYSVGEAVGIFADFYYHTQLNDQLETIIQETTGEESN